MCLWGFLNAGMTYCPLLRLAWPMAHLKSDQTKVQVDMYFPLQHDEDESRNSVGIHWTLPPPCNSPKMVFLVTRKAKPSPEIIPYTYWIILSLFLPVFGKHSHSFKGFRAPISVESLGDAGAEAWGGEVEILLMAEILNNHLGWCWNPIK